MPALDELSNRLAADATWRTEYDSLLPTCTRLANLLPLVHVAGVGRDGLGSTFESLFEADLPSLPTSADPVAYSEATRQAEDVLGMPRAAYFYAGRAHPEFGSMAIAVILARDPATTGAATPFDTGGIYHRGPSGHRFIKTCLDDTDDSVRSFCLRSTVDLNEWQDALARFLAAYFRAPKDYWDSRPHRVDPEEIYLLNDDWRAWTFEVRLWKPVTLDWCEAWCADEATMNALASPRALRDRSQRATRLRSFIRAHPPLLARGSIDFDVVLQSWVRQKAGVAS